MFTKTLTTERLILRPYILEDTNFWQKWDTDDAVQTFLPEPKNEPQTKEQLAAYFHECQNDVHGYYWTIVWKEANEPIGTITITEINSHHGIGELGIVIGNKSYWGKGVAQESIQAVVSELTALGLRRITAEFEDENVGMEKALIKTGFLKEAKIIESRIKAGKPINTVRYYYLSK